MIVTDTNVVVHLLLGGDQASQARAVLAKDSAWALPVLWRSEFRNVLVLHMRRGILSQEDALEMMSEAERLVRGAEYDVDSTRVLRLAAASGCTAYDCEFVALAEELGVPLVTTDGPVLKAFPSVAVSLAAFVA